jgi:hypothetical protein
MKDGSGGADRKTCLLEKKFPLLPTLPRFLTYA